jgi:hypothetical protein
MNTPLETDGGLSIRFARPGEPIAYGAIVRGFNLDWVPRFHGIENSVKGCRRDADPRSGDVPVEVPENAVTTPGPEGFKYCRFDNGLVPVKTFTWLCYCWPVCGVGCVCAGSPDPLS